MTAFLLSHIDSYSYDWNEMVKHRPYGSSATNSTAYPQIARLFQQICLPKNLDMSYGYEGEGSGAYEDNIPRTLKNFGYSDGGRHGDYNESTVFSELKSGYVVVAAGYAIETVKKKRFLGIRISKKTTYSEGHAWLLDRIMQRSRTKTNYNNGIVTSRSSEGQYLVHCNWGWNGGANGYYFSGAFTTNNGPVITRSGTSGHYQYEVDIVTGVRK